MRWLVFSVLVGCGSGGTAPVALSWQFADGRSCADTGAAVIRVKVGSAMAIDARCDDGIAPASVQVMADDNGTTIVVDALSPMNATLYSGRLSLDALPSDATVTLYASAMR